MDCVFREINKQWVAVATATHCLENGLFNYENRYIGIRNQFVGYAAEEGSGKAAQTAGAAND